MPGPRIYTPRRRLVMQVVMWLILGATVGLAELAVHAQQKARRVELAPQPIVEQQVSIHLPARWLQRAPNRSEPQLIVEAVEGGASRGGRTLRVYRERLLAPMSALDYLGDRFDIRFEVEGDVRDSIARQVRPLRVGPWPGVLWLGEYDSPGQPGAAPHKLAIAAAMLPSGTAIALKLDGAGALDVTDSAIVQQVAAAIEVAEPALEPADSTAQLPDGMHITAPAPFRFIPTSDPNRTDRRLWLSAASSANAVDLNWGSIEVAPCMIPPDEKPEMEFANMLAVRCGWHKPQISAMGPQAWQADPSSATSELYSARAYLLGSGDRGLLIVFRGLADEFAPALEKLRASVRFGDSPDAAGLLEAGRSEVARLRAMSLAELLEPREDRWLMWADQSTSPHMGWSRIQWNAKGLGASEETHLRLSDQRIVQVQEHWTAAKDWSSFRCDSATIQKRDAAAQTTHTHSELRGGVFSLRASTDSRATAQWSGPMPGNFIPGALVEHLLGKLAANAMLVRTDSFTGYEDSSPPAALALIIRQNTKPAREITVEVNGSGEIARFRYRADGELEALEMADGIQRLESTEEAIKLQTMNDPELRGE